MSAVPKGPGRGDPASLTDDVRLYLEAAAREPLLTKEQEVELAMAIDRGKEAEERLSRGRLRSANSIRRAEEAVREAERARQRFILANLRLVVSVARKYQGQGLTLLDLVQDGNIGLMRAVELFDWRRGFKFSTYATWWIRQAITRALADRGRTIRLPVHVGERIRKVKATAWHMAQQTGEEPTPERLAEVLDSSPEEIAEILELERREPLSLQTPVGEDTELGELIELSDSQAPFEEVEEGLVRQEIGHTMNQLLSAQERQVLAIRYGLGDGHPLSLRESGRMLGLSAERVRQVEREALAKLRESEVIAAAAAF
ncbi:MAG TPA: sigma-70 family RNA polymerase sigma factor [Actinomycetota bacterium]|jgi:RNA polymerase primary sigma factor|nr:sigma-70 family RNA polymerase sigma factor [Actinomycetota bacterium]